MVIPYMQWLHKLDCISVYMVSSFCLLHCLWHFLLYQDMRVHYVYGCIYINIHTIIEYL